MTRIKGAFGRVGDGRSAGCGCHGCCGREWADFPNQIYFAFTTREFESEGVSGVMHKEPPVKIDCVCHELSKSVAYSSGLMHFPLVTTWPDGDSEACCVEFGVSANCSEGAEDDTLPFGECYWSLAIHFTGGDEVYSAQPKPGAPCDTVSITGTVSGTSAPACIQGQGVFGGFDLTISESAPTCEVCDPMAACEFLCWETVTAYTLYATFTSEDCPEIDEQVIVLWSSGSGSWTGSIVLGTCPISIVLTNEERYAELDPCPSQFTIGACFSDVTDVGLGNPYSRTLSGTLAAACGCCAGKSFSVTISE